MDSIFCDVELVQVYEESTAFSCPEHFVDYVLELFHNFQEHPETDTPSFEDFLEDFKLMTILPDGNVIAIVDNPLTPSQMEDLRNLPWD